MAGYGGYGRFSHQWPVDQKPRYNPYPSYSGYGQFSHQWPPDNRPVFKPHQTGYGGHPYAPPQAPGPPPPGYDPAAAAAAAGAGGGGGGDQPPQFSGDFSNDPILMQVRAMNEQMIAAAKAQELAQRKQALIDFGDPALAGKLLAGDNATALAAGENPFSATRQLRDSHDQNVLGIDEGRNKQNLFYSTTRGNDLTGEGKAYLQSQTDAQSDLNSALSSYHQVELGVEQAAAQGLLSAQDAAYMRALNLFLAQAGQWTPPQPQAQQQTQQQGGGDGSGYQGQQHGHYWWY